ncbi:MAG TPA: hypothetical protein HA222_00660 [Candidatus Diapherotrites archaeon]|uniref:CopG family transcriptional regulator n=1 Tax=Candidatus Iainarchaeum sp. TaxID=3101447 RepID=A0A7J4JW08_9ARCH|nr:hypothetical protein [Candidatus Diapherotrites archaeon]
MVNMTFAIPEQIHKIMKKHPEVKWSEVARQAIEKKAKILEAEKDPWRIYAYKRWAEEGVDADELFKF